MEHGGDIESYRGSYRGSIIDFSSNINPLGIHEKVKESMVRALDLSDRYPDRHYGALKKSLAEFMGCREESVVVGNGAMEIIDHCIRMFPGIYIAEPCFNEYGGIAENESKAVRRFFMESPFSLNVDAFIENMPRGVLTILTNPNNPTGYVLRNDEIEKIYEAVEARDGYLLMDETFIEFVDLHDMDPSPGFHLPRMIKVRAATKSAALAGVRLGFASMPRDLKEAFEKHQLPWTVNRIASEAGQVLKDLDDYFEESRHYVAKERRRLMEAIDSSSIGKAYKSEANFILIELKNISSKEVFAFLLERGILVRTYSDEVLKGYIRIAVRRKEENNQFIDAWKSLERSAVHVYQSAEKN